MQGRMGKRLVPLFTVFSLFAIIGMIGYLRIIPQRQEAYRLETSDLNTAAAKTNARTEMTIEMSGRLGNNMFQYAALLGIAKARGNIPVVLNKGNELRVIFNLSAKLLSDNEYKHRIGYSKDNYVENCCLYNPNLMKNIPIKGKFVLKGFFQNWKYFHPHVSEQLRREFTFRKVIVDAANSFISSSSAGFKREVLYFNKQANYVKSLRKRKTRSDKVTYVGVHVRRGDITSHYYIEAGMRQPTMDYFKKAMAIMESLYENVFYLVCSDDLDWCRNKFGHMKNVAFCPGKDRVVDMAILSHSNHSILTVGSFGFWSAFLANGTTTYFGSARAPGSSVDVVFSYAQYFMPKWIKIP
ncbi:galactoside 2-alpha-L-fucosyltransferase SEC1-like [Tubulanus polymorphus]|uniref:galactoside 2-alpha-L-fucosyltransferase SEC1-like n=1 Tax=Tubulanus polymorphus TaxID=672921 RepID=UPI003DA5F566